MSLLQLPLSLVVPALVFLVGRGARPVVIGTATTVLLAELGQWGLARAARNRTTAEAWQALLVARPLDASGRAVVTTNLVLAVVTPLLLAFLIGPSAVSRPLAWVLLTAASLPGLLSLVRVRRRNTWLAVGRIPGRPRAERG